MELQKEIVSSFHDSILAGHPGFFKTLHLIKEHYWWPGMTIFLKKYIDGCATCQQMKPNTHPTVTPLMPIKSHTHQPFQQITMDFITDLPLSDGFDSIFVMVNQGLSKGVTLIPCNKQSLHYKLQTCWSEKSSNNLDYPIRLSQTEDHNSQQQPFKKLWTLWRLNTTWAPHSTLKLMDKQNTLTRN